jgi:hypothetical protein
MKKFLKKLPRRLWRAMFPQYVLYVQHRGKQQTIHIKSLRKKTPTKITGVNMQGEEFEIVSATPMDYYLEEFRDDLK